MYDAINDCVMVWNFEDREENALRSHVSTINYQNGCLGAHLWGLQISQSVTILTYRIYTACPKKSHTL